MKCHMPLRVQCLATVPSPMIEGYSDSLLSSDFTDSPRAGKYAGCSAHATLPPSEPRNPLDSPHEISPPVTTSRKYDSYVAMVIYHIVILYTLYCCTPLEHIPYEKHNRNLNSIQTRGLVSCSMVSSLLLCFSFTCTSGISSLISYDTQSG